MLPAITHHSESVGSKEKEEADATQLQTTADDSKDHQRAVVLAVVAKLEEVAG